MSAGETATTGEREPDRPEGGEAIAAAVSPAPETVAPPAGEAAAAAPPLPSPVVADGALRSLDPRVVGLDRLVGWISTASIGGFTLVAAFVLVLAAPFPRWLEAGIAALALAFVATLAWFAQRWPEIAHRHASYRVDADGIEIRRGVVWRAVINVPRSRVQHTDVSQGPLERGHGLGTLVIYTAGTDHARVDLHGLAHEVALAIRDHLLPRGSGDAV